MLTQLLEGDVGLAADSRPDTRFAACQGSAFAAGPGAGLRAATIAPTLHPFIHRGFAYLESRRHLAERLPARFHGGNGCISLLGQTGTVTPSLRSRQALSGVAAKGSPHLVGRRFAALSLTMSPPN